MMGFVESSNRTNGADERGREAAGCCEMSDIFMPELMELDSYWRRAVEDAICDTLKGEKRLHYALKNRKKINQKLEKLGLKAAIPQLRFSSPSPGRADSRDEQDASDAFENSASSLEDSSKKAPKPAKSRSRSRTYRETPSEKKYKSPDRPLLGDGSLEKMKKSQNSFNCEPMGDDPMSLFADDCATEYDKDEDTRFDMSTLDDEADADADEPSKKIQWLHVREDSDFDDSDSESSYNAPSKEEMDKSDMEKLTDLKHSLKETESEKKTRHFPEQEESSWGREGKGIGRGEGSLEGKLHLALAKRKIVNEAQGGSRAGLGGRKVQISASKAEVIGRRRKGHAMSSAFIQVYLEVYRELFHKCSLKRIASEAAKRWWCLTAKQKSKYANKKFKK